MTPQDIENVSRLSDRQKQAIRELWFAGFTIAPRQLVDYDAATPPEGMQYQWCSDAGDLGWHPVQHDRHPGLFGPYCAEGEIVVGAMHLMERPKAETDAVQAAAHAQAHKNVDDWLGRTKADGFIGGVTIVHETIETRGDMGASQSKFPRDMVDHVDELLQERDRLVNASKAATMEMLAGSPPDMAALRASCFNLAVSTIRRKYGLPHVDDRAKTFENNSLLPEDMLPHADAIFGMRDGLWAGAAVWWGKENTIEYARYLELAAEHPDWTRGQLMNAVLIPIAVKSMREHLKGKANGPTAEPAEHD